MKHTVRLCDVADTTQGGRLKLSGKNFVEHGFPAYGAGGLNGFLPVAEFNRTAIILSAIGARCGKCFFADGQWTSLANTRLIFPDERRIDPKFLWYQLDDEARWPRSGAAQPFIRPSDVDSHLIYCPALDEQKRIVAVLDEAFEGLSRARANAEANLADVSGLFELALNHLVLRGARDATSPEMDERIHALADEQRRRASDRHYKAARFVATKAVPALPRGWLWASPEQLCTHIVDCLHSTPKWMQAGEICLRTTNFQPGELDLSEIRYVSSQTYQERISRLEPKPGDVLYSREGGILGIACIQPDGLRACLGQRMMQFRLRQEFMMPEYFCAVLNSALVLGEVRHFTGGAAAPHLNIGDIRQFPIPVPPLDQQSAIVDALLIQKRDRRGMQTAYRQKFQDIDTLRQSLLQRAFSGELT